jgi:hypothetical protein
MVYFCKSRKEDDRLFDENKPQVPVSKKDKKTKTKTYERAAMIFIFF